MVSRTQKQILIGSVYILIALIICGSILYSKYRPTCNDGIKNGQEEGVDCGTIACGKACPSPIQPISIQSSSLVKTPAGDFDFAGLVYNPNTEYGSDSVVYDLVVNDSSGQQVYTQSYSGYILPGQTKYFVQTSLKGIPDGSMAQLVVKSIDWQKVIPNQDSVFIITREATTPNASQTDYQAVITNNTNFDFDTVNVDMVVLDSLGNVVATNMTNLQTFLSHTDRSVKVTWPFALPQGARIKTEVNTNVFNNANYLKTNGTQEKFQQYY